MTPHTLIVAITTNSPYKGKKQPANISEKVLEKLTKAKDIDKKIHLKVVNSGRLFFSCHQKPS